MGWLAPLFLLGLAGLAVPILVHLTERQRRNVVEFPSLMFLRKIPYRSVQRRKIHHWVLLFIRAMALALLVAAFARPFFQNAELAEGSTLGPREVGIVLDHSYSMGYGDRWERATAEARRLVSSLGASDRASLVLLGQGASAVVRSSSDHQRLLIAVDTADVSASGTRFGPGLKLAQTILEESELANLEVAIISDFQRSGWSGDEGVRFPSGTVVTTQQISEPETPNATVASVTLRRDFFSGRERMTATARVTRRQGADAVDLPIILEIDGQEVQSRNVRLDPTGSNTVTFDPFTLSESYTRGTVRLGPDMLLQDNELHFVLSPGRALRTLILEGSSARSDASLYMQRALEISEEAAFQVDVRRSTNVGTADLDVTAVVVLNDIRLPQGSVSDRLRGFVEAGGGILVVLGERSTWQPGMEDLMAGRFGAATDHVRKVARLGFLDYAHPIFEVFGGPRGGDFARARFFRSRSVTVGPEDRVLARFDDGSVALVERRIGKGRVLLWASTLDAFWNDLSVQPVFLPFMHQLVRYLGGHRERVPWYSAGQVLNLADPEGAAFAIGLEEELSLGDEQIALTPKGGSVSLPPGEATRFLTLDEQGFYQVRRPGSDPTRPFTVAVNVDVAESELEAMDPTELAGAISPRDADSEAGVAGLLPAEVRAQDQERRQALWRLLLVGALILLLTETAVSNWLSRGVTKRFEDGREYAQG